MFAIVRFRALLPEKIERNEPHNRQQRRGLFTHRAKSRKSSTRFNSRRLHHLFLDLLDSLEAEESSPSALLGIHLSIAKDNREC